MKIKQLRNYLQFLYFFTKNKNKIYIFAKNEYESENKKIDYEKH